jgi:hypothetical protein
MIDYSYEINYWGDCCNTFEEDQKHYTYAKFMGLVRTGTYFDGAGKKILDVGGGPSSMLLKCQNLREGKVIDPIAYPKWTIERYTYKNISVQIDLAENMQESGWDEVWIYNCLQHVLDPKKIIEKAKLAAPVLRIFEWVDIPAHAGHPQELTEEKLNGWIGSTGSLVQLDENGCVGKAYFNIKLQ